MIPLLWVCNNDGKVKYISDSSESSFKRSESLKTQNFLLAANKCACKEKRQQFQITVFPKEFWIWPWFYQTINPVSQNNWNQKFELRCNWRSGHNQDHFSQQVYQKSLIICGDCCSITLRSYVCPLKVKVAYNKFLKSCCYKSNFGTSWKIKIFCERCDICFTSQRFRISLKKASSVWIYRECLQAIAYCSYIHCRSFKQNFLLMYISGTFLRDGHYVNIHKYQLAIK